MRDEYGGNRGRLDSCYSPDRNGDTVDLVALAQKLLKLVTDGSKDEVIP